MALTCQIDCHQTWLQPRLQFGAGTAVKCYVAVSDEFTENPRYWATEAITYYFENGSYTVTTSVDAGPFFNEDCPSAEVTSTYDPEFDYGAGTDDPTTALSNEVTPPTEADALSALVWGAWEAPGSEVLIGVTAWHGQAITITAELETITGGFAATVSATRQQWRQNRGYTALPMAITWDDDGTPGSITIPAGGAWSGTIEAANANVALTDPTFYAGRYIP